MKKKNIYLLAAAALVSCSMILFSCHKDQPAVDLAASGFPNDIGKIILGKCATSGCHNDQSKDAAAGLSMSSWDKLFEGGNGGACIIPYRPDFSTTMYYVNNGYPEFGISLDPRMPYQEDPLSYDEIKTLYTWIAAGAPDRNGKVKFADDPNRRKLYCTNQGCDEVAVIDAKTKLVMRYIHVGASNSTESPHQVHVTPDGQHWCVSFITGTVFQEFRTSDDAMVGTIDLTTNSSWNTFVVSPNSQQAFVSGFADGTIKQVNLQTLAVINSYTNALPYAHGTALNLAGDTLYNGFSSALSNSIYKLPVNDPSNYTTQTLGINPPNNLYPHDLVMSPDGTKYLVSCQGSDEVRIMQTSNDSLLAVISLPAGSFPQEIAFSTSKPLAFVTMMEDVTLFPGSNKKGAVVAINTQTFQKTYIDANTYQPHGIAVDDADGVVFVVSRNINTNGPAPHHTSNCGGRNGYITAFDLNTFQLIPKFRTELSVDPYYITIRP
jgi:YVTN family beta-propeller protein